MYHDDLLSPGELAALDTACDVGMRAARGISVCEVRVISGGEELLALGKWAYDLGRRAEQFREA